MVFLVWLINDRIKLIFMSLILIIFGVLRKNREIPNLISCTDKKNWNLESISKLIIVSLMRLNLIYLLEMTISSLFNFSGQ